MEKRMRYYVVGTEFSSGERLKHVVNPRGKMKMYPPPSSTDGYDLLQDAVTAAINADRRQCRKNRNWWRNFWFGPDNVAYNIERFMSYDHSTHNPRV
jgi:hypothetical protein